MTLLSSQDLLAFHAHTLQQDGWAQAAEVADSNPLWRAVTQNHRNNTLLWDEEDAARRTDVPDADIARNKRNIDRYNQARNDAVERIDECLLAAIGGRMNPNARLHSETAGSMVDRLSILSLKVRAMRAQTQRTDVDEHHRVQCQEKLERLIRQRDDLGQCLAHLLTECMTGQSQYRIYRQYKMYNDPTLNPYLCGQHARHCATT
jgi:Protein of unknown function (DUF4254)